MNKLPPDQFTVKISNKEYRVTCPEGQENKLSEAIDLLNRRIEEEKSASAGAGSEQTIAITALNLAHELIEQRLTQRRHQQRENGVIKSRLQKINERLSTDMHQFRTANQRPGQF